MDPKGYMCHAQIRFGPTPGTPTDPERLIRFRSFELLHPVVILKHGVVRLPRWAGRVVPHGEHLPQAMSIVHGG